MKGLPHYLEAWSVPADSVKTSNNDQAPPAATGVTPDRVDTTGLGNFDHGRSLKFVDLFALSDAMRPSDPNTPFNQLPTQGSYKSTTNLWYFDGLKLANDPLGKSFGFIRAKLADNSHFAGHLLTVDTTEQAVTGALKALKAMKGVTPPNQTTAISYSGPFEHSLSVAWAPILVGGNKFSGDTEITNQVPKSK